MNRLGDIKGTLAHNLAANKAYRDDVEFLVIEFGSSNEVSDWISSEPSFQEALGDGYLRVVTDRDTLDIWHFGRAKNAFRSHLRGQIYSSLDADNFITAAETKWLLDVARKHPLGFVAHHFSGDFGDGTCGRVSMPAPLYRTVGYDPQMFPRQWDELGLMAETMKRFPAAHLVVGGPDPVFWIVGSHSLTSYSPRKWQIASFHTLTRRDSHHSIRQVRTICSKGPSLCITTFSTPHLADAD